MSFGCVCLIIPVMAVATVLEKLYGAQFAHDNVYLSPPVIALWGMASFFSLWYMLRVKLWKRAATFMLHLSFIVILIGALTTHLSGSNGKIHLRTDAPSTTEMETADNRKVVLPFSVELRDFHLQYYEGTSSPSNFVSDITIEKNNVRRQATISMNKVFWFMGYTFCQAGYDTDGRGSYLSVSVDPYGVTVTYLGYVWLLLSIILFFFQKRSQFKVLLKSVVFTRKGLAVVLLCSSTWAMQAAPHVLPAHVAEEFGNLYVYYNHRVAPLSSLAQDFTVKIYGRKTYKGLTPEQVLTGWIFYYDDWKNERMVKIKGDKVKELLGLATRYAAATDFIDNKGYKLDAALFNGDNNYGYIALANEKFNIISSLATGTLLKIFPYQESGSRTVEWFSPADRLPPGMPYDQSVFMSNVFSRLSLHVVQRDWEATRNLIGKLRNYQQREAEGFIPSECRFQAEQVYYKLNFDKPVYMLSLLLGFVLFTVYVSRMSVGKDVNRTVEIVTWILAGCICVYLTVEIALRWFVSQHVPLSNAYETMCFMAWAVMCSTLYLTRYFRLALPFGFMIGGLALVAANIGESATKITNLTPVLHSPLLSVHVMLIMCAYSLLAFILFVGLAAVSLKLIGKQTLDQIVFLQKFSSLLLYPAVFMLAIGVFIGAIWANMSWGRYWAWDPKETWALITLLIYSLPLHTKSLRHFQRPMFFHVYCVLAFFCVLATYFGVNLFLGGLHAYS